MMSTAAGRMALRTVAFRAMGTDAEVVVPREIPGHCTDRVRLLLTTWEAALSRFVEDSELSAMNRAAGRTFVASPLLFAVMQAALRAARATGGLYDPGMGTQIAALGYDRSFEQVPHRHAAPITAVGPGGAWRGITTDPLTRSIMVPPGCAVDLGGIAKGMAVDAAIGTLRNAGVSSALVCMGGDLRVIGRPPVHPNWGVALEEDGNRVIALGRGALATSSTSKRRWGPADERRHHLIDPSTGRPVARGARAVTVAARTCAQAEVAAKAALVAGPRDGADMLRRLGLDALVVPDSGPGVAVGNWPGADS